MLNILKKTLLLMFVCVAVSATSAPAIPPAIVIPEPLLEEELLDIHRKQIDARIDWWKESLLLAKSETEIQHSGEKLLGDYLLYPSPYYQQAFAEETLKQYTDVLNGKAFSDDDSFVLLKRINAALTLTKMDPPQMQPALQMLIADKNEGLRYIGWQGYDRMRKNLLNGTARQLQPLLEAVKKAVASETNPILLSAVYEVMNLQKIEGNVNEKLRLQADKAFLEALQGSWASRCRQVEKAKSKNVELLAALRTAVAALGSIGEDLKRADPKDAKSLTLCLQMLFDLSAAVAQRYDRVWQNSTTSTDLLESCSTLLSVCEKTLNLLADTKHEFLAKKLNPKINVPARGAAVLEAVLVHWAEALKAKGVKESSAAGE
ncbi:MAG: hypothetical protein JXA11_15050 [Phycisphaerae bacterium]|nr:hypothetical protein [Phycisphaerae bacterium]